MNDSFDERTRCQIDACVAALRRGEPVVIPTDTVYGVAAVLDDPKPIRSLFDLKRRERSKQIPVLVSDIESAIGLSAGFPDAAHALTQQYWPGALTIVVKASTRVPRAITLDSGTVGLRMPDLALAREVINRLGGALAVTSANISGMPEATSAVQAREALGDDIFILDGGSSPGGKPSTVVEISGQTYRILREASITKSAIEAALLNSI